MRTPRPLPPELLGRPVTAASLARHGYSRHRAYSSDLVTIRRGLRTTDPTSLTPFMVAAELARGREDLVACGITAAQVHGLRLPPAREHETLVHLARVGGGDRIRRRGVVGSRATYLAGDAVRSGEVLVSSPARTFLDLGTLLSVEDLVVVGDGLINEHRTGVRAGIPPVCTRQELAQMLAAHPRHRGRRRCFPALERLRRGADSRQETRLRLRLEDHGYDGWVLDHELVDPDGGRVHPDLWLPAARLSLQFEGFHHDAPAQRKRDVRRQRRTERAGARELRLVAEDLDHHVLLDGRPVPRAVALVAEALGDFRRAGGTWASGRPAAVLSPSGLRKATDLPPVGRKPTELPPES